VVREPCGFRPCRAFAFADGHQVQTNTTGRAATGAVWPSRFDPKELIGIHSVENSCFAAAHSVRSALLAGAFGIQRLTCWHTEQCRTFIYCDGW
jgi:hypothetical protein